MDHTRHMNIFNVPKSFSVTLIGAGGIGATTALALAKMGVQTMVIFDDDRISEENLPTQLHVVSDVGELKTSSLARTLQLYTDELHVDTFSSRVTKETVLRSSLVISAVDSIAARQNIWKAMRNEGSAAWWYLDARMAAEEFQMFLVDLQDLSAVKAYESKLMAMDENSAPDLPCTAKATFHCAMMASGHIGVQVRNIVRGESKSHRLVHNLPSNFLETFPI